MTCDTLKEVYRLCLNYCCEICQLWEHVLETFSILARPVLFRQFLLNIMCIIRWP